MFRHVLIATDGSDLARRAVDTALEELLQNVVDYSGAHVVRLNLAIEDLRKGLVHWKAARIKNPAGRAWPTWTPKPTATP